MLHSHHPSSPRRVFIGTTPIFGYKKLNFMLSSSKHWCRTQIDRDGDSQVRRALPGRRKSDFTVPGRNLFGWRPSSRNESLRRGFMQATEREHAEVSPTILLGSKTSGDSSLLKCMDQPMEYHQVERTAHKPHEVHLWADDVAHVLDPCAIARRECDEDDQSIHVAKIIPPPDSTGTSPGLPPPTE